MSSRLAAFAALVALVLVGCGPTAHPRTAKRSPTPKSHPSPTPKATPSTVPIASTSHILLVMEENQGYAATQSNCGSDNTYFCQLASKYASAAPWYGVSHPSLPNYLAITSGSTQGCGSDSCGTYAANNLGEELTQAGVPWFAYMESMPSACDTASSSGEYAAKHNPFVHYSDLLDSGACGTHDLPYPGANGLISTLDGPNAPDFVWITPNLIDDMHDGTVTQGSQWLQANVAPILNSPWFLDFNSTVIVTEDENDAASSGSCCGDAAGGQIPAIIISRNAIGKGILDLVGDHYGTLRAIEEAFGLPLLGGADQSSNGDLTSLFG